MIGALKSLRHDRLSLRLVFASLIIGGVLSVFSTGAQVYSSFNRQKQDLTYVLDQIEQTMVPSLRYALWQLDFGQVETILAGLITSEIVTYIDLTSPTGHRWTHGEPAHAPVSRVYALTEAQPDGEVLEIGTMKVELSLETVKKLVWAQFWILLISNVAKAYIAALALLLVVHRMIIRHLVQISEYVSDANPLATRGALCLNRCAPDTPDALDRICASLEGYRARVSGHVAELETEIATRQEAERVAKRADKARTSFLANMSHEIREPLNSILGLFHLIKEGEAVPAPHRQQASVGHKAAQRLLGQFVNILDLSRLDSGGIQVSLKPTNIRVLAHQWLEAAQGMVHRRNKPLQVFLEIDPTVPQIYDLDGARLTQIVNNLTDNASKFTDTGQIQIKIMPGGTDEYGQTTGLVVLVSDTGAGVSYEHQDYIFERFTQIDAHSQDVQNDGTGLGLAVSRDLAQLMQGTLTVQRSPSGDYSTEFRLTLENVYSRVPAEV